MKCTTAIARSAFCAAVLTFGLPVSAYANPFLMDVEFQAELVNGMTPSNALKVGYAAMGQGANDFWNYYTRDDGHGGANAGGSVVNLALADGTVTGVGLTVDNGPGAWCDGSADPMYDCYIYPFGGDMTITVTNLPDGMYEVLPYSADGSFEVLVGGISYGVKVALDSAPAGVPVWTEGVQYVRFTEVAVSGGQALVLKVRSGLGGYATLAGMQIAQTNAQSVLPLSAAPRFVFVSVKQQTKSPMTTQANGLLPASIVFTFTGTPSRQYSIQRAFSVSGPWMTLSTVTVGDSGVGVFTDSNITNSRAFYRAKYP